MNRKLVILLAVLLLFGSQGLFANAEDQEIPLDLRNNRYFQESLRLANLANLAFMEGDYSASYEYSEEAIRYTYLSDEYVLLQLKIREVDGAIIAARERMDFADSINASARYPDEYQVARAALSDARLYRAIEDWDSAIESANLVLAVLAGITGIPADAPTPQPSGLPSQYTVRNWANTRDSFWVIAGWPWVYNDSHEWRRLYEANRQKLPQPDNPDLILPGMIMDIPSIRGESRQGMWDPNTEYPALR